MGRRRRDDLRFAFMQNEENVQEQEAVMPITQVQQPEIVEIHEEEPVVEQTAEQEEKHEERVEIKEVAEIKPKRLGVVIIASKDFCVVKYNNRNYTVREIGHKKGDVIEF